jgi:hypothetical protein
MEATADREKAAHSLLAWAQRMKAAQDERQK